MKLVLPLFLIAFSFALTGQSLYRVSGQISGSDGGPLSYASIILLKSLDSSFVKGAVSEDSGKFIFSDIPHGTYRVLTSMVGFASSYSEPLLLTKDVELEPIKMSEQEALAEVVIVERKPLYTHKVDRLVINIENSIVSVGGTALEILERSPGVVINRQNNTISLVGKEGVVLLINGKNSNIPTNALVQLLQGMAGNSIESIELLTTPPSNYDAEGNAGFINVVLKKRMDLGLNGSYAFSVGYGLGFINSDNINFNYRKDKVNLFGSYSFLTDNKIQQFLASRKVFSGGNVFSNLTTTERDAVQRNHNVRIGLDYELSDKTILGVLFNTYDNRWSMNAFNQNTAAKNNVSTQFIELMNDEVNLWQHAGANINVKQNVSKSAFWTLNLDYLYYKDDNPNDYNNSIFDEHYNFIRTDLANSTKLTPINTFVGNWDYANKLSDKVNLELGVKATVSTFNNDVEVNNFINGTWVNDIDLTNNSILDEKIYAIYSAMDISLDAATTLKAGLRFEQTDSELETDKEGKVVDRNYGKIFPTIFLNRKINKNVNMNWSYSKRITRPTFNDLAPFVILLDPTTFLAGNAALQPAISNNFKYDITYASYFLSLQYTHQSSPIASFQERIDKATGRLIFEASNLDYTKTYSATVGMPIQIAPFWKTQNNFSLVYQTVRATRDAKPLQISLGNYSLNSIHAFKLSSSFNAELSGFYNSPGFFGIARYKGFYGINAGVQKSLGDKWGSLKFSVNDIFESIIFKGGTNIEGEGFETDNSFDFSNRTFTLTYSRNFGRSQVKSSRDRKTGSEEERGRVNQ
ncbi:MAG: outer membrane beta-barrel protein [Saprospiraceae bacterium]|nr:outer membrane beta-barrel protein [Saprospiraceae bacterium]